MGQHGQERAQRPFQSSGVAPGGTKVTLSSPKKTSSTLPTWAQAALVEDARKQPWKEKFGNELDDPNFSKEKDTVLFYSKKVNVCFGEGSMAA